MEIRSLVHLLFSVLLALLSVCCSSFTRTQPHTLDPKASYLVVAGDYVSLHEIDLNDLGLKKTFSVTRAALQARAYNDLMMEAFYDSNPAVTFIHGNPGAVRTSLLENSETTLVKLASPLANVLLWPLLTSPEDCGEYMWHAIFNRTNGGFRTGSKGEDLGKQRCFGSEEAKKLWDHTVEVTAVSSL